MYGQIIELVMDAAPDQPPVMTCQYCVSDDWPVVSERSVRRLQSQKAYFIFIIF